MALSVTRRKPAPKAARGGGRPVAPPVRQEPAEPAEPVSLDSLAAHWLASFEAARSALAAGSRILGPAESARRGSRLAEERVETIRLLRGLEHELHAHSRLVSWLGVPGASARMVGLPAEVTACVFDLDGVLTTSAEVHAKAWTETFDRFLVRQAEEHHRPYIPFDRKHDYPLLAGRPRLDGIRAFLASRGLQLSEEAIQALADRKNELLQQHLDREGVAAFEGSRGYLEAAHLAGLARAVVSPSANTTLILHRAGLDGLVEAVVDGNMMAAEHLRPKPTADTLLAGCRLLGVEPARVAAFETTPAGIAAARAAGVKVVIGVDRTGEADVLRASDADRVVVDLAELLKAVPG